MILQNQDDHQKRSACQLENNNLTLRCQQLQGSESRLVYAQQRILQMERTARILAESLYSQKTKGGPDIDVGALILEFDAQKRVILDLRRLLDTHSAYKDKSICSLNNKLDLVSASRSNTWNL